MAITTRIMQAANLSYDRLKEYLDFLVRNGLLERRGEGDVYYILTPKGDAFLSEFRKFERFAKAFGIKA